MERFSQALLPGTKTTRTATKKLERDHMHWLVPVGLTMATTVVLLWLFQIIWSYGILTYNDLLYGRPRTYQIDAVVGPNDSAAHPTHLVAMNLGGQRSWSCQGVMRAIPRCLLDRRYQADDADLVPVTLRLVDRQSSHHPDLLVQCGSIEVWFTNQHGAFVAQ